MILSQGMPHLSHFLQAIIKGALLLVLQMSTTEAITSIRSEVDYLKRHVPKMMKSPSASVSSSTLC